ncbi:MAG: SGNH/GDSL hydrolase family protein [Clostridia bacterium]|nr:SGNH/GDSL hydrolase family protein [Clostridia bacterium]
MKKVRILFQGDSITDAGRDRRNYFNLGGGYPSFAAPLIREAHPELELEFINLGISGNRTGQLFDRLYPDAVALKPDIVSILIGINDIWHRYNWDMVTTTDEQIELNYRCILERLKKETDAKIMILAPYLLDCEDKKEVREDLCRVLPIVRRLAEDYADVYIPLDELFDEALKSQPEPKYYSGDGVHPNANGARFIGEHYAKAIEKLL